MHRFEIVENVLCERSVAHLLACKNKSATEKNIIDYNYLKKKKLFKLISLRKIRKKIKKKLRKAIRALRNQLFPAASAQLI